ncbi:MAG: DNA repair protein RecN [Candidatus Scalindua sp. AMX11]|nr:MAG: DNA repair protein RecN [Candidatus Scalindua sp.]NOG86070.1 DNA repair protein RecN [Planctomycetota bacterium]RZV98838.1 MAG: DNA repair protein RecN [Candidatus Scalindua sp. SCAELEC01]TDE66972.1 MAG: DNA repair protein RecN [Candidatus Scalindua sp. AMX11]GJQ57780.1 MAG: DNA repair protein RecN [Candidatus Scalindua sp.]
MLSELYISNFALIDSITVQFDKGLNIVTGTTGVGKSLIIGALNFLLGSRTSNDVVKTDKKEATVSGVFLIENGHIREEIQKHVDIMDDEIIMQRRLDQKGRNRCTLNNQPITVSLLREIGELLVNIHGQQEHETLTNPHNQLAILDTFGKSSAHRTKFAELYSQAREKERHLSSLKEHQEERKRQINLYQFEIEEIENADLKPDELSSLSDERTILVNTEKIQSTLAHCLSSLYESDDSIVERLREVTDELAKAREIDKGFEKPLEACNQTIYQLEDAANILRADSEKYEYNPERLREIEERIETIRHLTNKYGATIEEILLYSQQSEKKLEQLLEENENLSSSEKELVKLRESVTVCGKELSQLRKKAGTRLSSLIKKELSDLGIRNGKFEIAITTIEATDHNQLKLEEASSSGFDRVEFMFSSGPGEEVKPLRKIASGGETSRIMLALKRHLAMADRTPVLVFDEIDANIGGRMGKTIGEKLKLVSQTHQVICITHLPQIASYADQHMMVNKSTGKNSTKIKIEALSPKSRIEEIAEMIRGDEKSDVTRKQAREMMADAKKFQSG